MKDKIFFSVKHFFSKDSKVLRRKVIVFSIFVFVSATFWLLNALTKEYSTFIEYPVKFKNIPDNNVFVGNLPENIQMYVKGYGFSLIKYQTNILQKPYVFDFKRLGLRQVSKSRPYDYFTLTKSAESEIESDLSSDIQIIKIYPDTLFFSMASVVSKKVPVKPDLKVTLDKQYVLSDKVVVKPDSVNISGPKSIIDTIDQVLTNEFQYADLSVTIERNVALQSIDNISIDHKRAKIYINVEKFTENTIVVPVTIINQPDSILLEIFPEKVDIKFNVGLSNYNDVKADDFKIVADYDNIQYSIGGKLKLRLLRYPSTVYNIDFSPKSVDYILKK